ncbi:hypothetical protein [Peptoniphilus vaginalis]|uniref:hypothetical protein n=1 Tax=Peptoniphilus vaginalis TaxID=1756987 RepID=UPI0023F87910|nr:hypothetical protein [Peptoniphilus vaginalis]
MIKTVMIDGKEVPFKVSASFPLVYKANFNTDILTLILPLLSEILEGLGDEAIVDGKVVITPLALSEMLKNVYSLEYVDIMNLFWTLAKCADDSIPEPIKWFGQFDEFPMVDIGKEVFPMLFNSLISKKKLGNLATTKKKAANK